MSEKKYDNNIVKFGLENSWHECTSTATHVELTKDDQGVIVDQSVYRIMIKTLLYLTTSHPNITFFVGVYVCYQANPKTSHLT